MPEATQIEDLGKAQGRATVRQKKGNCSNQDKRLERGTLR